MLILKETPVFIVFKNGEMIDQYQGTDQKALEEFVQKYDSSSKMHTEFHKVFIYLNIDISLLKMKSRIVLHLLVKSFGID